MDDFVHALEEILGVGRTLHGVEAWLEETEALTTILSGEAIVTEADVASGHVFSSEVSTLRQLPDTPAGPSLSVTPPNMSPPRSPAPSMHTHRWM